MEACVQVVWAKEQEPRMGKEGKPLCYRGGHHLYSIRCDLLWRFMKCIWELFKWEDHRGRSIYAYIPRPCWTRAVLGCQLLHIARWHRCESATPLGCPLLWYQRSLGVESKKQAARPLMPRCTGVKLVWACTDLVSSAVAGVSYGASGCWTGAQEDTDHCWSL